MTKKVFMQKRKRKIFSGFTAQLTSTVSVALVLLLIGIIAFLGIAGRSLTDNIKENMGFNLVFSDNVTTSQVNSVKQTLTSSPKISSIRYYSKEDALNQWQKDTGEDLMAMLGVNPFSGEMEVKVKADYACTDSIDALVEQWRGVKYVDEIVVNDQMTDSINRNVRSIAFVLSIIAAALLFISFALINNTVRLTVYSRRFLIHTMKLVGATGGFIRRPIVAQNMVSGLIAGLVASLILGGIVAYFVASDPSLAALIPIAAGIIVIAGLIILGIIICGASATFATNKYLRTSYDNMFN